MSKLIAVNKFLTKSTISRLRKIDPNIDIGSDAMRLKIENNIPTIVGLQKRPSENFTHLLTSELIKSTKSNVIAAQYHKENSGIQRNELGGLN